MTNIESIRPTLLQYINYAARAQNHFKMFSCPLNISSWNIPSCECGAMDVRHCFPFASAVVLNAAEHAIAYTARLREYALFGDLMLLPLEAPTATIPFLFVHAVLRTMLSNPNRPTYHHTGQITGYCRRNGYTIEPYSGRFGRGYRVHYPSAKASTGRHQVEYYIYTQETQS